jgi:hypothetical protein
MLRDIFPSSRLVLDQGNAVTHIVGSEFLATDMRWTLKENFLRSGNATEQKQHENCARSDFDSHAMFPSLFDETPPAAEVTPGART